MKKSIINKIVAGVMLSTTIATTACGKKDDVRIESYELIMPTGQYYVYDQFSLDNLKLKLKMSDGSVKEIAITNDMIVSMPDMQSSGTKSVTIKYDGKEYTFSFVVSGNSKDQMIATLQEFMQNYDAVNNVGSTSIYATIEGQGKYLADEGEFKEEYPAIVINQTDTQNDALLKHLYSTIIGQITKSGLETSLEEIIDSNTLTAKMNYLRTYNNIAENIVDFDYIDYLCKAMVGENNSYVNVFTDSLCEMFCVSDSGRSEMENWVRVNIGRLRNHEEMDFNSTLESFKNIVVEYTEVSEIAECVTIAYEEVSELDVNIMSSFMIRLANADYSIIRVEDEANNTIDTVESKAFAKSYLLGMADFIKVFEDLTASLIDEEEVDVQELFDNISAKAGVIADLQDVCETNGYRDLGYGFEVYSEISNIASLYQEDYLKYLADILEEFELVEMLVEYSFDGLISKDMENTICSIIYDSLRRNENYDYESYIDTICAELEITDSDVIAGFKDEFAENKTFSICSYMVEELLEELNSETEEDVTVEKAVLSKCIDLIKYVEQLPVSLKTDVEEDKFSSDILFDKIKAVADEIIANSQNINDYYIYEPLVELVSNMFNSSNEASENIKNFVADMKFVLIDNITMALAGMIGFGEESQAFDDIKTTVSLGIEDYLDDKFNVETFCGDMLEIINNYCDEETRAIANSLALSTIIIATKDQDIDYNELFVNIPLPDGVSSIDYNQMVAKIYETDTYKDLIKISDVEIQYVTNENNEIIKQILSLTISSEFDVLVASFSGNIKLNLEVTF